MRKIIRSFISRYIFSDSLSLEARIFNLVLVFGILAEIVAVIARIVERVSLAAVLAVVGMIIVTSAALWVCNKFSLHKIGIWIALVMICDILFPLVFFTSGGADSGMAGYFVLCIVLTFFLLKGKECFCLVSVHIVIISACYLVGKFYPRLVVPFNGDFPRYVDIIQTIVVAGILTGMLIKYQNRIYELEKSKAEAATKAKADFLANVSHEIRTPLNAVIGLGEIEMDKKLPADTLANLEKMHNSGMILLSIINDLLDISKIESGHFELITGEYETPSLINDTVNLNMVRIGSKPIVFKLIVDEKLPYKLFGDELRVRQVLNNLLSNAFKYTREGLVRLEIRQEPFAHDDEKLWLVCTIEDTGIGIREEDIDKLFSVYNQVDTRSNRHIEGTGLGLSICKNLVELMGGTITVKSEYGKGSAFTVRLPQGITDARPLGREVVENLAKFRYSAEKRDRRKKVWNPMPYARVLLVDDVATNLDVAKGMMMPYGLTIDCADSGKEAIKLIKEEENRYNAVFMDHMMPEMDGIEAVRIIRNEIDSDYARTVPIIALTANALIGNDKMFLEKGFHDFLTKPIDMTKLDVILSKWVRNKEKEDSPEWAALIMKIQKDNEDETSAETAGTSGSAGATAPGAPAAVPAGGAPTPGTPTAGTLAAGAPTPAAPAEGGSPIEGIDFKEGVKRMGNREAAYVRVLTSFSVNMPALLAKIRNFRGDMLQDYTITVHGIKGSSYGICANEIGRQAEALEMAAKNSDFETIIEKNDGFILQMEKLIAEISKYITSL